MRPHQIRYSVLLVISLALHILVYLLFLISPEDENKNKDEQAFQVTLRQTPNNEQPSVEESLEQPVVIKEREEPKLEDIAKDKNELDQEPSPLDNADEMSTNNQDENIKGMVEGGGLISKEKPLELTKQLSLEQALDKPAKMIDEVDVIELKKSETLNQEEPVEEIEQMPELIMSKNTQALEKLKEIIPSYLDPIMNDVDAAKKQGQVEPNYFDVLSGVKDEVGENFESVEVGSVIDLNAPGNILMLADTQLSEVTVPQPFSVKKSDELKLVNQYIKRMNKQVMAFWINPYRGNKRLRGIVRFELNTQGYLVNSYVYRESGDKILDISVLDAIRSVRRFKVPDNAVITERYYQNLGFHFSSIEQEIELMPFETESSNK
ncbi:MAG: hypothetical protein ACI9T7_002339 [Oleiphilaceae bacterium]|jgi:hypothetical protein